MINIVFKPDTLELEVTGHAGHDKKGRDIVCAAISTLFYTLGEALIQSSSMLYEEPLIKDADGEGYIVCHPKEEYVGNIARTYWTILVGMEQIALQYPKNVSFTVQNGC
jgi:uncharacterized protein YsxB (DUF464 family)